MDSGLETAAAASMNDAHLAEPCQEGVVDEPIEIGFGLGNRPAVQIDRGRRMRQRRQR